MSKPAPGWEVPEVVSGDWASRRDLATAIRALSERCITAEVDGAALAEANGLVRAAMARLAGPQKTSGQAWADRSYHDDLRRYVDRGALVGRCNPVAPPLRIDHNDGISACEVVLDERYVGAPGIAHGGVVASIYDQMCGHAVVWSGFRALTIELTVQYLRPTPLHRPVRFDARVSKVDGRVLSLVGACIARDQVISRCHATFKQIDAATADALFSPS
jgi:acyl-coenzyme A thioesterase PaaI-like protein